MYGRRRFMQKLALGALAAAGAQHARAFVHPLDQPAHPARIPGRSPFLAVARAGSRLVAAGVRGQIVYSDDGGRAWLQAKVPVSADLVALAFHGERLGWAVGHGGAVLHTADAGANWTLQLDGRKTGQLALEHLRSLPQPQSEDERSLLARMVDNEIWMQESGGAQPFMGVFFESEDVGYVVGTFNRIFRTADGGRSWTPWGERVENPSSLHFNAVSGADGKVFLAGEQGSVWRLDRGRDRFVLAQTSYAGTLFGLSVLSADTLLAFGMRGNVFRSANGGRDWRQVDVDSRGGVTAAARRTDGTIVLVTQAGTLQLSKDEGLTFSTLKPSNPMPYFGVTETPSGEFLLAGAQGLRIERER